MDEIVWKIEAVCERLPNWIRWLLALPLLLLINVLGVVFVLLAVVVLSLIMKTPVLGPFLTRLLFLDEFAEGLIYFFFPMYMTLLSLESFRACIPKAKEALTKVIATLIMAVSGVSIPIWLFSPVYEDESVFMQVLSNIVRIGVCVYYWRTELLTQTSPAEPGIEIEEEDLQNQ